MAGRGCGRGHDSRRSEEDLPVLVGAQVLQEEAEGRQYRRFVSCPVVICGPTTSGETFRRAPPSGSGEELNPATVTVASWYREEFQVWVQNLRPVGGGSVVRLESGFPFDGEVGGLILFRCSPEGVRDGPSFCLGVFCVSTSLPKGVWDRASVSSFPSVQVVRPSPCPRVGL